MRPRRVRSGYSLPEVLVAVVLLGVIGGALTKLIVSQMRFFDNVTTTRSARSVARSAMHVILSDLRMVQGDGGGVTAAAADGSSITVNVPYTFGVLCGSTVALSTVSMMPTDSAVLANARYAGYAVRTSAGAYAAPVPSGVAPVNPGTTATCTANNIKTLTINGRAGLILDVVPTIPTATYPSGSSVYFYQSITYRFAASTIFPGKIGLWRTVAGGTDEELMGPFASSARFNFYTSGSDASTTTLPALDDIRGLDLVLTAISSRTPAGQTAPSQSQMVTSVFFKNVATP
jgi:prepilin-type N-terminal cleavage/methylation domain-containing protein